LDRNNDPAAYTVIGIRYAFLTSPWSILPRVFAHCVQMRSGLFSWICLRV